LLRRESTGLWSKYIKPRRFFSDHINDEEHTMIDSKKNGAAHEQLGPNRFSQQVVRQDRYRVNGEMEIQTEEVGNLAVLNFSLFGIAATSTKSVEIDTVLQNAKLCLFNEPIADLALIVRRCIPALSGGFELGLESLSEPMPLDRVRSMKEIMELTNSMSAKSDRYAQLPAEFRLRVLEAARTLKHYEGIAKSFESRTYSNRPEKENIESVVIDRMGLQIFEVIRQTNWDLQKIMAHQDTELLKVGFQYFRDELGDFIFQSPFTKRSYEKPRGYAGDYEMMRQIYSNDSFAQTLFGSCVENAVQRHQEPSAVRNRGSFLAEKIASLLMSTDKNLNFLSVASGPAEELKRVCAMVDSKALSRATFWLLDQDEDALKYAQRNVKTVALETKKEINLKLLNLGIKQVLVEGLPFKEFDMIYSAGLFDYFTDPVAVRAAKALSQGLNPGAQLIIGNFNITSPNWFGMLTLFDWHLILRAEQDLLRLYDVPGCNAQVESEPENVNLFCVVTKG